ncbi:hypothetical protein [Streptomyces cucumeris]|uniref:hypothetical protein n=1 Tax=Streptomyces cucumeris TaxID=2962890 RepID=UPI003D75A0F1
MQPTVGRVVIALVNPITNNGADVAPAVITRVWDEHTGGGWTVNYKVLLDQNGNRWVTSARLFDSEEQARVHDGVAAFWPPRVG